MDSREKALEILKAQIREQRARIDPRVLKMAEIAANSTQRAAAGEPSAAPTAVAAAKPKADNLVNKPVPQKPESPKRAEAPPPRKSGTVPYDREAAINAITLFLKAHDNPASAKAQLQALLDKETQ